MLRLFSKHARTRVEVFAYAHGADDGSSERQAIAADADHFVDVSNLGPKEARDRVLQDRIHVLVDYDGLHDFNSVALLALRPAPVIVTWLGFAGPSGLGNKGLGRGGYVDFVLADPMIVSPTEAGTGYSEAVAYMPSHSAYQPQDELQGDVGHSTFPHDRRGFPDLGAIPVRELRREHFPDVPLDGIILACLSRNNKVALCLPPFPLSLFLPPVAQHTQTY